MVLYKNNRKFVVQLIELFSIECRKTKNKAINLVNYSTDELEQIYVASAKRGKTRMTAAFAAYSSLHLFKISLKTLPQNPHNKLYFVYFRQACLDIMVKV